MIQPQEKFMHLAIEEAKRAQKEHDYAVGAVVVKENNVIAVTSNKSRRDENPIAHAETLAIIEACKLLKSRHLPDCVLYTTHEPCPMCASVAVWAKLKGVVYGARYQDMKSYRIQNGNGVYLWRTIDISCEEVFQKSTEHIDLAKDFMREECLKLFHNE